MPLKLRIIHSALMAFVLCLLMTCWVTAINLGIHAGFVAHWLKAFVMAYPAAAIIAFFTGPIVLRISEKLAQRIP